MLLIQKYFTLFTFSIIFYNASTKQVSLTSQLLNLVQSKPIETFGFAATNGKDPTFATRITKRAFEFFSAIAGNIMTKEFPKVEFPNVTFPINGAVGFGTASTSDIKILQFLSPNFNIKLTPPDGVYLRSVNGAAKVRGDFKAEYTVLATVKTSGWFEAQIKNIRSQFTVGTYGEEGRPQLRISDCAVEIQSLKLDIGGGVISWLANLFRRSLSELIKEVIHTKFCESAQTTLVEQFNDQLRTLPTHIKVVEDVYLDYLYTNDPIIEQNNAVSQAFLTVTLQNYTCDMPTQPLWIDPFVSDHYMTSFWLEGTVFQCMANSIYKSNVIQYVLTKDFQDGKFKKLLSTSCKFYEVCLGRFYPDLSKNYSNSYIDLHFYSANATDVKISMSGIKLDTHTYMDFHISPMSENPEALARLEIAALLNVMPLISYKKICGVLKGDIELDFTTVFTKIGSFHESVLNTLGVFLGPLVRAFGDGVLRNGFPIPLLENVTISDGAKVTTYDNNQIRIDADLQYIV